MDRRRTTRLGGLWALALCVACAHVPEGRYGVDDLSIEGVEQLDDFALKACLATRERQWLSIDLSKSPAPSCGEPPFDAKRIHLPLWIWPWAEWPLYEPSVFDRDLARIERWYRARGYYGARILSAEADPPEALYGTPSDQDEVRLRVKIEEGLPVLIRGVQLEGIGDLPAELGGTLLNQLDALAPDERFDEVTFELTKSSLVRTLRDGGYASAEVQGHVEIHPKDRAADIRMTVVPGPASVFGNVCVEGYEKLPAKLILEASDIVPGQPFSESDLEDARTRIYQMRVFSEVEIIAGRKDPETGASKFGESAGLREGEWAYDPSRPLPEAEDEDSAERTCQMAKQRGNKAQIPIDIRVKPGRLYRWGVGAGIQTGVEDGQRAITAASQWDVHLFAFGEIRNFLGGLRRLRLEERPRLVFLAPFPYTKSDTPPHKREVKLGNNLSALLEWPAFLEARTLLRLTATWDRGPDPFGGKFIRDDIDVGIGPSRGFLRNRLFVSVSAHVNPYIPREVYDHTNTSDEVLKDERYNLFFTQQTLEWDQRDDKASPRSGRFIRFAIDETLPPSNWSYVRVTPEAREYLPLPYGLVLAGRFGIGVIHIYKTDDYYRNNLRTEELQRLGPRPYRLRGGGPYSVRGRQSGELGLEPQDYDRGYPGGTRSWIGSLELRVPLGDSFGIAFFGDAGDVDGGSKDKTAAFRFDRPNTTLGGGLRYKTIVGPVRLDVGWLVPGLQGNSEPRRRDRLFGLNGAVHLTIGEAF